MDSPLLTGERPTSEWKPGEVVKIELDIPIEADAPAGVYELSMGIYQWPDLSRLSILDENGESLADRLVLAEIQIGGDN